MTLAATPEPVPLAEDAHGTVRIGGTRVTLETVVAAFDRGESAEEIREQYPALSLGDIYAVLTYLVRHPRDVAEYIAATEQQAAEVRARLDAAGTNEGLRARLRARLNQ